MIMLLPLLAPALLGCSAEPQPPRSLEHIVQRLTSGDPDAIERAVQDIHLHHDDRGSGKVCEFPSMTQALAQATSVGHPKVTGAGTLLRLCALEGQHLNAFVVGLDALTENHASHRMYDLAQLSYRQGLADQCIQAEQHGTLREDQRDQCCSLASEQLRRFTRICGGSQETTPQRSPGPEHEPAE